MSSAVAPAGPAAAGRRSWPIRSGTVPTPGEGFDSRPETAPSLAAALPAGAAVALVPDRAAVLAAIPGPVAAPDAVDWLRSSGKTVLAAAWAERLWQSGNVDLLVWIDATSRDSVLSGYAAATADVSGRDQVSSCESVAAQFLTWLGETSRSWLVVLDDLADKAILDDLWPTGPAGRVLVTSAVTGGRLLGGGHPDTMLAARRLAGAYLAAGRADDAIAWFQWVLDGLAEQLGPVHHDVIEARRHLGHACVMALQLPAAIAILEEAVPQFERIRGPEHADTLGARDELAAAHLAAGHYSEAITRYRRTLADRERAQGSRHPQTITTRHGLASSYLASGRAKEAVAAYKRVVADQERVLGPDHLDTLTARNDLGAAYQQAGKTAAAELACEQAWAGFERVLGPRHPDTLRSRARLAQMYLRLGRYGDARALLRDTVGRLERTLPDGDPLITELRQSLADIGDE